jgi:hypothetical protein
VVAAASELPAADAAPHRPPEHRPAGVHSGVGSDAAAEDAAYLHILGLLKAERAVEARRAAQRYLQLFPNGFRRTEVQTITLEPAQLSP